MYNLEWVGLNDSGAEVNKQKQFDSIEDAEPYAVDHGITDYRITM